MADNSLITQEQYNEDMKRLYEEKIYPYLNGATHTGCVPLGTILPYFGETAPTHFLICDGTTYNKADYPELAAHLLALTDSSPYVVSGDDTKFKVPDLRGEFLRGTGTNSHTNQGDGANVGVHQDGTEHMLFQINSSDLFTRYDSSNLPTKVQKADTEIQNSVDSYKTTTKEGTYSTSENNYYTSRPTNTSVTYIIAYRNAYIDLALDSFPIDITQPTDGQLLMYDATAGRWVNGGHKYSTDEHIVGTWIDGRPLYEKTVDCGTMPNNTTKDVNTGITNEKVIGIEAFCYNPTNGVSFPLPFVNASSIISDNHITTYDINLYYYNNTHILRIKTDSDRSGYTECYVTLRYTKTTDTV